MDKDKRWGVFLKSFSFLFLTTSLAAFLLYFGVRWLMGYGPDRSPVNIQMPFSSYEMAEIGEHPFAYLLSLSSIFSLVSALWITLYIPRHQRRQIVQTLIVPWIAVILTSPLWGLIFSMYLWHPEHFSDLAVMLLFYRTDMATGLMLGWLCAIQSFPINLLSYATVCGLLFFGKRYFLRNNDKVA